MSYSIVGLGDAMSDVQAAAQAARTAQMQAESLQQWQSEIKIRSEEAARQGIKDALTKGAEASGLPPQTYSDAVSLLSALGSKQEFIRRSGELIQGTAIIACAGATMAMGVPPVASGPLCAIGVQVLWKVLGPLYEKIVGPLIDFAVEASKTILNLLGIPLLNEQRNWWKDFERIEVGADNICWRVAIAAADTVADAFAEHLKINIWDLSKYNEYREEWVLYNQRGLDQITTNDWYRFFSHARADVDNHPVNSFSFEAALTGTTRPYRMLSPAEMGTTYAQKSARCFSGGWPEASFDKDRELCLQDVQDAAIAEDILYVQRSRHPFVRDIMSMIIGEAYAFGYDSEKRSYHPSYAKKPTKDQVERVTYELWGARYREMVYPTQAAMVIVLGRLLGRIAAVEKATRTLTPEALAKGRAGLRYVLRKQMEASVPKATMLSSKAKGALSTTLRVGAQAGEGVREAVKQQQATDQRVRSVLVGAGVGGFLLLGAVLFKNRRRG